MRLAGEHFQRRCWPVTLSAFIGKAGSGAVPSRALGLCLNPLFVSVDEINEALNVVATTETGLFLAQLQALPQVIGILAAVQNVIAQSRLLGLGPFDVLPDPIAHFTVGDAVFDHVDELV